MSFKSVLAGGTAAALLLCTGGQIARAQVAGLPLLDQTAIRSPFAAACNGQPDSTALPVDPRSLVVPGVNTSSTAAVQFNAYYVDLHNPPAPYLSGVLPARPQTCGDFNAAVQRGYTNLTTQGYFQPFSTAAGYYNLWQVWGYTQRPADFDQEVINRYGLSAAPYTNPYPLPGEDPTQTNGGSGQLPLGFVQSKNSSGQWTGLISVTCSACHNSTVPGSPTTPYVFGRSNDANDAGLTMSDELLANPALAVVQFAPIPWSVGRGSTDAIGIIDLLPALFDMNALDLYPSTLEYFPSHAGGMAKAPNWWYRSWKTRQFWDGALTSDNVRSEMAFAVANLTIDGAQRRAIYPQFEDNNDFMLSLSPPVYSQPINTALAEQGAQLFHELNLWANGANAAIPKPPGNGSCAGCHGVYSPAYAADPNYLPDPRLKGVAGVVTPEATIGTDPQLYQLMSDTRKVRAWNTSWFAYDELSPTWTGYNDSLLFSEANRIPRAAYDNNLGPVPLYAPLGPNVWNPPTGYIAPPLYGAWAAAPYFHNGSVPTIWDVLKPADRPAIWQRNYTAVGAGGANAGYDRSTASYDFQNLGWVYTTLPCDTTNATPYLPCTNNMSAAEIAWASTANQSAATSTLAFESPPPIGNGSIPARMIYNSYTYSQGNGGHLFTQSLTDAQRLAILEYLKTL
jgi:exo-cleaving rubber dioxygenase